MAEGLRDVVVSIEKKLVINEWPWQTTEVITDAAIKWPYGISLLFVHCSFNEDTTTFEVNVTLRTPSFLTMKLKLQATWQWPRPFNAKPSPGELVYKI